MRGERTYLVDDVREALEEVLSERTPVTAHGDSIAHHELGCSRAKKLEEKVSEMEKTQRTHGEMLAEFIGAQKLQRWLVPIVTGVLASSVAAAIVSWLIGRHT